MSTPEEIKAHNDKAILNLTRATLVEKFALSIGCTEQQATTLSKAYGDRFTYDGAVLSFNGVPVVEAADAVKAHLANQGLDFLLPAKKPVHENIADNLDPALVKLAASGNLTAKGALHRALHGDGEMLNRVLEKAKATGTDKPVLDDKGKTTPNPWSAEHWNLSAQGRIVRSAGGMALAQRMAEAAGVSVGATRPRRVA